jgi:hypothetical protein
MRFTLMKWFIQYNSLSSKQRDIIEMILRDLERKHWVQGFAGSGKTLVMLHLIGRLGVLRPDASICFITYTNSLVELADAGFHDLAMPATRRDKLQVMTHFKFLERPRPFDFVFLDEVQDISATDLESIKRLSRHLYIAGDPDQRIYGQGARSTEIERVTSPRQHRLVEIFRLTRLLKAVAVAIHPKATIVASEDAMKRADVKVKVCCLATARREARWVFMTAIKRARTGEPCAILIPNHDAIYDFAEHVAMALGKGSPPRPIPRFWNGKRKRGGDYGPFNRFWADHDVPLRYFGNGYGNLAESSEQPMVYLMTYHSAKGVDFRNVFLPGLDSEATIVGKDALRDDPELGRRLLFVAVTRSRENLIMSHSGRRRHEYLTDLPPELKDDEFPRDLDEFPPDDSPDQPSDDDVPF